MSFILLFSFSSLSVFSDNSWLEDDTEISCEDLPTALKSYNQDIQLERSSVKHTLSQVYKALKTASKGNEFDLNEFVEIIEDLKKMNDLVSDNELIFISRADNIEYFVEDCLKNKE